jgi:hypothetical protein
VNGLQELLSKISLDRKRIIAVDIAFSASHGDLDDIDELTVKLRLKEIKGAILFRIQKATSNGKT